MVPNILKVFVAFFLLTFCINDVESKINTNIFSIIDENTLQRKLEFTIDDTLKSSEKFSTPNGSKLLRYLSLVSDEMNEMNQIDDEKFKEDPIPLPPAYVELSPIDVKFHEISFDDFGNFKKAPVRLETVIPDGSDQNTVKIVYESKINEIVLSGLAEINGTNYNFFLNITDLTLREEHERTPAPVGKIVTKSILETLTFKKFTMLIMLTQGNQFFKSPNKQILRRLSDSWLVRVVNTVNSRFVRSKIIEQSQQYFKNYKNAFLETVCSTVKKTFINVTTSFVSFEDENMRPEDSEYYHYSFQNNGSNNLANFSSNCSIGSFSTQIEKNCYPNDDYYSHDLIFASTYGSNKKFIHPAVLSWTLRKLSHQYPDTTEKHTLIVRHWSLKLTVFTDKNGRKTDDDIRVNIDFNFEDNGSTKLDDLPSRFTEYLKNNMTTSLRDKLNSFLSPPAKTVHLNRPTSMFQIEDD